MLDIWFVSLKQNIEWEWEGKGKDNRESASKTYCASDVIILIKSGMTRDIARLISLTHIILSFFGGEETRN